MSAHEVAQSVPEVFSEEAPDWNAIAQHIRDSLELSLARHPKVGAALTFGEGEKLITDLSSKLTYDIRRRVEPDYDA